MPERFIQLVRTEDPGDEEPAATRERLKDQFPRGVTRRMTQLGLLLGAVLDGPILAGGEPLVYASVYAESRALEGYLESFPAASPTLFQTSIHPSAVQQVLIGRQQSVAQFFPLTGRAHLAGHAVQTALLAGAARVILCGGEERGAALRDWGAASDRAFAFALALTTGPEGALGRLALAPTDDATEAAGLTLPEFFDALAARRPLDCAAAPGLRLTLAWT
jgi:hypothetical protein